MSVRTSFLITLAAVLAAPAAWGEDPPKQNPPKQEPPKLVISDAPDGQLKPEVTLRVPGDSPAGTAAVTLYVRNEGGAAPATRFVLQLRDKDKPLTPAPTVTVGGAAVQPAIGTPIPANNQVTLTVTVSQMTAFGTFTGFLAAESAQPGDAPAKVVSLLTFTVERQPVPKAVVAGADPAAGLKRKTSALKWDADFRIDAESDAEIKGLRVAVSPLTGPDGRHVMPTVTVTGAKGPDKLTDIPPLGSADMKITADLPLQGDYVGTVALIYDRRRESVTITVTRTRDKPTIEFVGAQPVADTADFWWCSPTTVVLTLRETAGRDAVLTSVAVTELARTAAQKKLTAMSDFTVLDAKGEPLTLPLTVPAGEHRQVRIRFDRTLGAGEYAGVVEVGSPDGPAVGQAVTLYIKEPWWVAALFIGAGVVASYYLRQWLKSRPKLVLRMQLAALRRSADDLARQTAATPDETPPLTFFRRELTRLDENLDAGTSPVTDADVKELADKIGLFPAWVTARRKIEAVRPPALAEPFRGRLAAVTKFLTESGAAKLEEHKQTLAALPGDVDAALGKLLTDQIAAFRADVDAMRLTAAGALQGVILGDVTKSLAAADAAVQGKAWAEARDAFDVARTAYVSALVGQLDAELNQARPLGFTQPDWAALVTAVRNELAAASTAADADRAMTAYRIAHGRFVVALAAALRGLLQAAPKDLSGLSDAQKKPLQDRLDKATATLTDMDRLAREGNMSAAAAKYAEAKVEFDAFVQEVRQARGGTQSAGGQPALQTGAVPAGPAVGALAVPPPPTPSLTADPVPTYDDLKRRLQRGDCGFALVIALIAVFIGVYQFWAPDLTWGGFTSWAVALLWGLGLHQTTAATVDAAGLSDKFAK